MMTSLGSLKVLEVMSEAVNVIAEGEVLQLMNVNDPDITEENYMRHHLEGSGIDKIAYQNACRITKRGVGGGFATTHV